VEWDEAPPIQKMLTKQSRLVWRFNAKLKPKMQSRVDVGRFSHSHLVARPVHVGFHGHQCLSTSSIRRQSLQALSNRLWGRHTGGFLPLRQLFEGLR